MPLTLSKEQLDNQLDLIKQTTGLNPLSAVVISEYFLKVVQFLDERAELSEEFVSEKDVEVEQNAEIATTKAGEASASASAAAGSAETATNEAGVATDMADAAIAAKNLAVPAATTAVTKAGEAATSASSANDSKVAAGVSETNASNSAIAANNSKVAAGNSEINAATSAASALASRDAIPISSQVYATDAAGRATVADGQTYLLKANSDNIVELRRRTNSGASTSEGFYPSLALTMRVSFSGPSPIVFDFAAQTITIPGTGYWARGNTYYNNYLVLSTASSVPKVIAMPGLGSSTGTNYFFADFVTGTYYCVNNNNRSTVPPTATQIATWWNATGLELTYFSPSSFYSKAELFNKTEIDAKLSLLSNIRALPLWAGPTDLVFDFVAKTITMPVGYWVIRNSYYNNSLILNGTSLAPVVFNMPPIMTDVTYFFADFSTATYFCVKNSDRGTVSSNAVLIATWWANGVGLSYFSASSFYLKSESYNKAEIDAKVATFADTSMRLISPSRLYLIDGVELPIYKSSIVPVSDIVALNTFKIAFIEKDNANNNAPRYRYFDEMLSIESSILKPSVSIGLTQTGNRKNYLKNLNISRVSLAYLLGKLVNVLELGDSLTAFGMPAETKTQLAKRGVTATMVGTMVNDGGQRGEGRAGWEFENFIGKDNNYSNDGTTILPDYSNPSSLTKNPYLKLADATDKANHPDWCFRNTGASEELTYSSDPVKTGDFYLFDFGNYIAQTGVAVPDIITIAAGTNDLSQDGTTAGITQSLLSLEIMIRQIKAAYPTIKIGIIPGQARGVSTVTGWADTCLWIENCMKLVNTLSGTYTNLHIVPVWIHQNRDWNFPVTEAPLSSLNDSQVCTISDNVHWSAEGRIEYANAMASFIANLL